VFKEIAEATLKFMEVPSAISKVVTASEGVTSNVTEAAIQNANRRFQKVGSDSFSVPDLRGISMRDVATAVGQANIKLKFDGSGVAVDQSPTAGGTIRENETFRVSFRQP
jgi:hypothetical protein